MTAVAARLISRLAARIAASGRFQWWAVFVPVALMYLATMRTIGLAMSADPTAVTPAAWGLAHHGTPIVAKADWPFYNPWYVTVGPGEVVSNRPPGLVFLATPFYWLFSWADSYDQFPSSLVAALTTAAAVATFGLLIRRLIGGERGWKVALAAALIGAFATTTWAVSGTQLFPHGPDQLLLVLAMLSLAAGRSWGAGLAFAYAVLVRPPLALVAAVMGLWRSWTARRVWPAIVIGAGTAVGLGLYLAYSHRFWNVVVVSGKGPSTGGTDTVTTVSRGAINHSATHGYFTKMTEWAGDDIVDLLYKIAGALVSPGRGLLIGAPFLLLLLPGVRRAWKVAPPWVRSAAVGGVLYLLVQLKVEVFTGGSFFWSYRYPLETLTLCGPLLVLCWKQWTGRSRVRRAWFGALALVALGLQGVGAISFHGPYPDTPWTFDNLAAALSGDGAIPGYLLLGCTALGAALLVWRGYRGRADLSASVDVRGHSESDSL